MTSQLVGSPKSEAWDSTLGRDEQQRNLGAAWLGTTDPGKGSRA